MVFRRRKLTNRVQTFVDEFLHLLQKETQSGFQQQTASVLQAARLEERILMSASPMAIVAEGAVQAVDAGVAVMESGVELSTGTDVEFEVLLQEERTGDSTNSETDSATSASSAIATDAEEQFEPNPEDKVLDAQRASGPELIVIDYRVQDADTLLESLLRDGHHVRLLRLDADLDGLRQITEKLEQVGNVSAIHLLTHARDGEILLGSTHLNATTLAQHTPELLAWQHSLTANADLLIYGCDVAESIEGRDFLDSLSVLTGADIASSTDATGDRSLGGDWDLEFQLGYVETQTLDSSRVSDQWHDLLGVITVSTTNDVLDGDTSSVAALLAGKGVDGFISLREAIIATNNTAGADTIFLTAGTFTFSIEGGGEDSAFTGDLDITDSLTIMGAGPGLSTINAASLDRVFELHGAITTTIEDVTIRGGLVTSNNWGGGIYTNTGSTLNLSRVVVTGNSTGSGAGIYNYGTLVATDTIISNNTASDWGGGLFNDRGNVTLNRVTISGNTAAKDGGAIDNFGSGASMSLTNVTLSGNVATGNGGGIWTNQSVTATNVTIAFNDAASGEGIFMQGGGADVVLRNSVLYNTAGVNANRALTSLGNNIDSDGTAGLAGPADQSGINPLLDATLQDNGGFVTTHLLLAGSSAIDTGSTVSAPTMDARTSARDSAPDLGAFEVQGQFASRAESLVNTITSNTQATSSESRGSTHAVAAARDGSHVVVWSSLNQDGGGWGIYGQRFDAAGNKVGVEFLINQTTANDQKDATVAMNGRGDFVVSWTSVGQDGFSNGVYARRYNAVGTALGGEFRVNATTSGAQDSPVVAMAADGRFLIVWEGQGTGDTDGIFGRWYAADGTPSDTEIRINTTTLASQGEPSVAMAPDGNAVVVWNDLLGVWAQRFNADGSAAGSEIQVESNITAGSADVQMAADGSFVVAYRQTLLDLGVYFRRFNDSGTLLSIFAQTANTTSLGNQSDPSIAMDDTGNFLIVWEGIGTGDTDGVFGRRFTADGTALSGFEFRINSTLAGMQGMASATMLTDGSFVVAWSGAGASDSSGVYTRQFADAPPTITAISDQTILENGTTGPLSFTVGDAETSTSLLAVTASSSNPGLVSPGGLILGGFGANRTITVAPNAGQSGTAAITVTVDDGFTTVSSSFLLTVTPVGVAPVITSNGGGDNASISVAENSTAVTTVIATDANLPAQTLTYSISGGADSGKFAINSSTGALRFVTAPNFESTTDVGANNVYDVIVRVSDGSLSDTQAIAVTVTAVNDNTPNITSNGGGATASISIAENATAVTTVMATDADLPDQTLTYSIFGGTDAAKFAIDSTTGALSFLAAPNYEVPTDIGANNVYNVNVLVSDGTLTDGQSIAVTVTPVNDNNPIIFSNGGGAIDSVSIAENSTAVTTVTATDADLPSQTLTYAISGGSEAAKFTINSVTGALSFVAPPNFETPTDSNANNVYVVQVTAHDGNGGTVNQTILVTVSNVNETPSLTVVQPVLSLAENASTLTATAIASLTISDDGVGMNSLSLTGTDAAHFEIVETSLRLKAGTSLNFEAKTSFTVQVVLNDAMLAGGPFATQNITLNVSNVDEVPTADAGSQYAIAEGGSLTVTAGPSSDPEGLPLTYQWDIDNDGSFDDATGSTATLTWAQLRTLSIPVKDSSARVVRVRVTDAGGNSAVDSAVLTIADTAPTINVTGAATAVSGTPYSINLATSDPGNDTISSFRIIWGDGTSQIVSGMTTTVPHIYSTPGGTRSISVTATNEDGTHAMTGGLLLVTVGNTAPSEISLDNVRVPGFTARAVVGNVTFVDPDIGDTHTIAVSDIRFQVVSGELRLKPGISLNPNIEVTVPVTITVTDLSGASSSVTFVIEVNRAPVATTIANVIAAEDFGTLTVSTASAFTDSDGDVLTYSMAIVSQDAGLLTTLTINSVTGQVTATSASNRYGTAVVDVTATDGSGASAVARLTVSVQPVNDAPVAQYYTTFTIAEQALSTSDLLQTATDPEGSPLTAMLISSTSNGTLTFNANGAFTYTPNQGFVGTDNFVYVVSDGSLLSTQKVATITVQPPVINVGTTTSSGLSSSAIATTDASTSGSSGSSTSSGSTSGSERGSTNTSSGSGSSGSTTTNSKGTPAKQDSDSLPIETTGLPDSSDDQNIDAISLALSQQFQTNSAVTSNRIVLPHTETGENSQNDQESTRRSKGFSGSFLLQNPVPAYSGNRMEALSWQREVLYRSLIQQNTTAVEELGTSGSRRFSLGDQVVGSVEVVTTVSSVGYLVWNAVRGGVLLSSLLSQIPAWNMLDPLLVIDGDSKNEDKESLQNIMDQQQKRLKREDARKDVVSLK